MIDQTKIESYKEVYNALKEMGQLKDFRYPKEKKHLDFSCIAGDTLIKFRLFSDKDLLQLRAEQQCGDKDDEKNGNRIRKIAEKYDGVFGTAYDDIAILNMSVPLTSTADGVAKKLILDKTKEFAGIVINEMADLSKKYEYRTNDEETVPAEEPVKAEQAKPENQSHDAVQETQTADTLFDAVASAMNDKMSSDSASDINGDKVSLSLNDENTSGDATNSFEKVLEDLLSEADIPDGDSKLENYEEPKPNENSDAVAEDQEMEGAVRRQIEQQAYRENILQEMRDLVAREREEVTAIKQEADEVAEKNRKENERLKESWNKYHKSNKNLEKRISAVSDREKKVMAKELELAQREDDIKQRESETNVVKAENEEKSKELEHTIEENHNLLKTLESRKENLDERESTLDTREKALDVRQERIEMDRKTVDQSIQDMYAMERMLKELKGKVAPVDTSKYEREIKALREEKEHYYDFVKKTATVIAGYKKQIEEAAAINEQLQEQVRTLAASLKERSEKQADSTELISARSQLEDATKKLQDEQRKSADFENELNELKRKNNELSEKLASSVREPVIETLSSAGYTVSPIAGEGNPLITFEIDGCTAIIDEHLGMVCLEKKVKRNYIKTFDAWNSQSFAETYSMSKGKAYCRFAYENIIEDIRRIAAKLNTLK